MTKAEFKHDEVFPFLDALRESGEINMFGAGAVVQSAFGLSKQDARDIVKEWMQTFGERHQ